METKFCALVDSNGENQTKWDINNKITPKYIKGIFFGSTGTVLLCDGVAIPISETSLEANKSYVVPVRKIGYLLFLSTFSIYFRSNASRLLYIRYKFGF
jgi:hypothetical protein